MFLEYKILTKYFGGHLNLPNIRGYQLTIFGWNAMHCAWVLRTPKTIWHMTPPSFSNWRWNGLVIYRSYNGTPGRADWMFSTFGGWDHHRYKSEIKRIKLGMNLEQYNEYLLEQMDELNV